jgi:signal transduction histidine kinase
MAAILTFYMVRALRAFEVESQLRLETAHQARLDAQAAALEAERRISQQMERLNEELRLTARELSLLLDLSNLLATPMSLQERLRAVLRRIVESLYFSDAGMVILARAETDNPHVQVTFGFSNLDDHNGRELSYDSARELGEQTVARKMVMCRHLDGTVLEFPLEQALAKQECRQYQSPTVMISLPLTAQQRIIGSIVLVQSEVSEKEVPFDEFKLMMGIAQQLGLSMENARLYQEAQSREKVLGELLHQVVGAQEAERKRIARELHDATGQSLTAITLGLRGIGNMLAKKSPAVAKQIEELRSYGTNALSELRHIIADLRPSQLDDLGLVAALQWYVQEFEDRYPISVEFMTEGEPVRLLSEYETVLFRITQEALTNIAKHANATEAVIRLKTSPNRVDVSIQDDGRGFDPKQVLQDGTEQTGWGLVGIVERTLLLGGDYQIDSAPGQGSQIRVSIPIVMERKDAREDTSVVG